MPGPGEPEYEAPDESAVVIPREDGVPPQPSRPASAAPSESASALPGAIDSDGEEHAGDQNQEEEEKDDDDKGRYSDLF